MDGTFAVTVSSGSLRDVHGATWSGPHAWTPEGVTVSGPVTGAHLLHAAVGACVLNDAYREASSLGIAVAGVRVTVDGGFDPTSWTSTGIRYRVEADTEPSRIAELLDRVEDVAEIPRALRAGAPVERLR